MYLKVRWECELEINLMQAQIEEKINCFRSYLPSKIPNLFK